MMTTQIVDDDLSYLASSGRTPDKSYYMLMHCDSDVVSWNESGEALVIKDVRRFEDETLPSFFPRQREGLPSFIRSLNAWGFQKAKKTAYHSEYSHSLFRRGHPDLLRRMKRGRKNQEKQATSVMAVARHGHHMPLSSSRSLPSRDSPAQVSFSGSLGDTSDTENGRADDAASEDGGETVANVDTAPTLTAPPEPASYGVSSPLPSRCPTPTFAPALPTPTPLGSIVQFQPNVPEATAKRAAVAAATATTTQDALVMAQSLQNQMHDMSQSVQGLRQETSSQLQILKNDMETRMRRIENLLEMFVTTSLATQSLAAVAQSQIQDTSCTPSALPPQQQQQQQQQQQRQQQQQIPMPQDPIMTNEMDALSFFERPCCEEDRDEITDDAAHFLATLC